MPGLPFLPGGIPAAHPQICDPDPRNHSDGFTFSAARVLLPGLSLYLADCSAGRRAPGQSWLASKVKVMALRAGCFQERALIAPQLWNKSERAELPGCQVEAR